MFRGVVANISISDAEEINAAFGGQVGSRIAGGYVEGAYNVLSALAPASDPAAQRLSPLRALQHPGRRAGRRRRAMTRSRGGSPPSGSPTSRSTTSSSRATTSFAGTGPAWARTSCSAWGWDISSSEAVRGERSEVRGARGERTLRRPVHRRAARRRCARCAILSLLTCSPSHLSPPSPLPPAKVAKSIERIYGAGAQVDTSRSTLRRCYRVSSGGALLGFAQVRNVKGKDQPITYLVAMDSADALQGHRHPGVPGAVRRRGGLRALAQAVPRQDRRGPLESGRTSGTSPERRSARTPSPRACARRWPTSPRGTRRASSK